MAWWRPEEEASPQSRIGARIRPVEPGAETPPEQDVTSPREEPPGPADPLAPAHPPLPRRRFPISIPVALVALAFVAVMVLPFIAVFGAFSGDDDNPGFSSPPSHDGPSLIPRERFSQALAKIKEEAGLEASLTVLRVAPERIDAVVRKSRGERAVISVQPDLTVRNISAGGGGQRGLSLNRVDPAVPERLVRAGAERLRAGRDDVSYLALSSIPTLGGGGVWSVFFAGGAASRYVIADLDGSNVRVPGQ